MTLRALTSNDIAEVERIERATSPSPWTARQFADALSTGYQAWVIQRNNAVAGFCIMQAVLDEATLLLISVDPQYQRQGLATQLLQHATSQLPEAVKSIFLEVRQSNTAAQSLYFTEGFNEIGMRPKYYAATTTTPSENALLMAKQLAW